MLTTFKATAKKTPVGLQVATESRGFQITMDEPKEMGGTDTGMNPVEALLCSLGACQTIVCMAFAKQKNFSFEEMFIELEGDLDPDGFLGKNPDVRNGFQNVRFTFHFKTNETQEKCEEFVKFVESTCPVGDCLANTVPLSCAGFVRY